jgi:predicted RNA-binding Zn-ribbon protein involved in translation (DUF1610 family)
MKYRSFSTGFGFAGGSGSRANKIVILSLFMIALSVLTLMDYALSRTRSGVNWDQKVPFKCTKCGLVESFTIRDLNKINESEIKRLGVSAEPGGTTTQPTTLPVLGGPMMGPLTLECPKCKDKTLTQAVECLKCQTVFIMNMDPMKGIFDDKCPKCGESFSKAWREKYAKEKN